MATRSGTACEAIHSTATHRLTRVKTSAMKTLGFRIAICSTLCCWWRCRVPQKRRAVRIQNGPRGLRVDAGTMRPLARRPSRSLLCGPFPCSPPHPTPPHPPLAHAPRPCTSPRGRALSAERAAACPPACPLRAQSCGAARLGHARRARARRHTTRTRPGRHDTQARERARKGEGGSASQNKRTCPAWQFRRPSVGTC